ncbi:MAG TPA: hypothetical protein VK907_06585, partial [Phnomibacter sp.]|nr:hypothetical protein [Phnomibacter sp.]
LFDRVHLSDLYHIIMKIPGVISVKYLQITNYLNGVAQTDGIPSATHTSWTLLLGDLFHLNFDRLRSKVTFFKGNMPITADRQVADRIYADLKASIAKPRLDPSLPMENDLPVPKGTPFNLSDYFSVQNDLPATYGTGRHGIPAGADLQRKTHIRQLKAYLLFFDQLLANYLSQLHNIRNLFSISNADARTYFFQPVYDVPVPEDDERRNFFGTAPLLKDLEIPADANSDDELTFETKWKEFIDPPGGMPNAYMKELARITEADDGSYERRNRFLDHLLARFAEDFSSYAAMMYAFLGQTNEISQKRTGQEIAEAKFRFINKYPLLSYNRAKGQFYKSCPPGVAGPVLAVQPDGKIQLEYDANTSPLPSNGSGLQRRASMMLGMQVQDNAPLVLGTFHVEEEAPGLFRFQLIYDEPAKLLSAVQYPGMKDAFMAMEKMVPLSIRADADMLFTTLEAGGKFFPEIRLPDHTVFATGDQGYDTHAEADDALAKIRQILHREGMKLVDHILLRPLPGNEVIHHIPDPASLPDGDPKLGSVGFFPLCEALQPDCDCPETDHYSFRISIVLPYWPARLRNMDFRKFAEDSIHRETPAHILPRFCWVSMYDMWRLETAYHAWFAENSKYRPDMAVLRPLLKKLITVINTLTNVYPEGHLHDCDNPGTDNPVILGQTILGTF